MVPHLLPTADQLLSEIKHLPLQLASYSDANEFYLALLTRVRHTLLRQPVYAYGTVGRGYGRGGKKLGVPTANLKPDGDGPLRQGTLHLHFLLLHYLRDGAAFKLCASAAAIATKNRLSVSNGITDGVSLLGATLPWTVAVRCGSQELTPKLSLMHALLSLDM
jgi:Riboflavin kinase